MMARRNRKSTGLARCRRGEVLFYCHHEKEMIPVRECWPCEECWMTSTWPCSRCRLDPCPFSEAEEVIP